MLCTLFKSCSNTQSISQLHSQILKSGLIFDSFVATKLTSFYGEYTSLECARQLFDETPYQTVHQWNAIIRNYSRAKQFMETLYLFHDMISTAMEKPDNFTVPITLKSSVALGELNFGKCIHGFTNKTYKMDIDMFVGSALIEFYSKFGQMDNALKVLEEFPQPDIVLWTSIITGYQHKNNPKEALEFFIRMVTMKCVDPNTVTLVSVVSACAQLSAVKAGKSVHGFVIRRSLDGHLSLFNSLLNLYAKGGAVKCAANLFGKMREKDVISWSTIIACYAQNGDPIKAMDLFSEMVDKRVKPNVVTVVTALQACAIACNLEEGKKIHEFAIRNGFELDISVSTALIDMYVKCSSAGKAVEIFKKMPNKDVVSFASLINGLTLNGMAYEAVELFCNMLSREIQPDAVCIVKILTACSELGIIRQALCFHGYIISSGFDYNIFIAASLIELYSKCGCLENSTKIFDCASDKDVVIWSSMIKGYGIHGRGIEALKMFQQMVSNSDISPNSVTFLSVLSACSHTGLIKEGIDMFSMMVNEYKLKPDLEHFGIMVDLLGRVGELDKAVEIINEMPTQAGSHIWGALLGACRIHHNIPMGEVAADNLFCLDPNHAGYYILLSNIYAVEGKWESVRKHRNLVKERGLHKMFGESVVEVNSKVHTFLASNRDDPNSEKIYEILEKLEVQMRRRVIS